MSQSDNTEELEGSSREMYYFKQVGQYKNSPTKFESSNSRNANEIVGPLKQCGCHKTAGCRSCYKHSTTKLALDRIEEIELQNIIQTWIAKTPFLSDEYLFNVEVRREEAARLAKRFKNLLDDEYLILNLRDETKKWLDAVHLKLPKTFIATETKHQAVDELIQALVNPDHLTPFEKEIISWIKWLPVTKKNDSELFKLTVEQLGPVVLEQTSDREKYKINLLNNIEKIVEPLKRELDKSNQMALPLVVADLASRLSKITPEDVSKTQTNREIQKQLLFRWLNDKPGFLDGKFSDTAENLMLVEELLDILKVLKLKENENFRNKLQEYLRCWLQHAAMKKNIFLGADEVEIYLAELLNIIQTEDKHEKSQLTLRDLQNLIKKWLLDISKDAIYSPDAGALQEKVKSLAISLSNIADDDAFETSAWTEIENWITDIPIKFLGSKIEQERHKWQVISNLILKLCDFNKTPLLDREVQDWVDNMPFENKTHLEISDIIEMLAENLRPIVMNQTSDKQEYRKILKKCIVESLSQIHLRRQSFDTLENKADDLVRRLLNIPKDKAVKKLFSYREKQIVFDWLNNLPGFTDKHGSDIKEIKELSKDLVNILNNIFNMDGKSSKINVRDNLKVWLKYTALRKNLLWDHNTFDKYVDNLMNKLNLAESNNSINDGKNCNSKRALPLKEEIAQDLVDDISDILFELNIHLDDQDELETHIANILADIIHSKKINSLIINKALDDFNLAGATTEGKVLQLCKGKLNFYEDPFFSVAEVNEEISDDLDDIFKDNNLELNVKLKLLLTDTINKYFLGEINIDKLFENTLRDIKETVSSEEHAKIITNMIINRTKKKKTSIFNPIQNIESELSTDVTEILDKIDYPVQHYTRISNGMNNVLKEYALGHASDGDTIHKLSTKLRRLSITEPDIEVATRKLIASSKQKAKKFIEISKKNMKIQIESKVEMILQKFDLQIEDLYKLINLVSDVITDYILGYENEDMMQKRLKTRLGRMEAREIQINAIVESLQKLATEEFNTFQKLYVKNSAEKRLKADVGNLCDMKNIDNQNKELNSLNILVQFAYFILSLESENTNNNEKFIKLQKALQKSVELKNEKQNLSDSLEWLHPKKVMRINLKRAVNEELDKMNTNISNQDMLKGLLQDTMVDYAFGKVTEQSTRDKLKYHLNMFHVEHETAEKITGNLIKRLHEILDKLQVFPQADEMKFNVTLDIDNFLEQTGADFNYESDLKKELVDAIIDIITDGEDDIDTRNNLLRILSNYKISSAVFDQIAELFMIYSKKRSHNRKFPVSKKDLNSILTHDVSLILDRYGVEAIKKEDMQKTIVNTLTDRILGHENDLSTKSELEGTLEKTHLFDSTGGMICDELFGKRSNTSQAFSSLSATKYQMRTEIADDVENILDLLRVNNKDRTPMLQSILEAQAEYILGRKDELSLRGWLRDEFKKRKLNGFHDLIDRILDISKKEAERLREIPIRKSYLKNTLESYVFDALELYSGSNSNHSVVDRILDTLTNHILGEESTTSTKHKLKTYLKNSNIPHIYSKNISEKLLDISYVAPAKEKIIDELRPDVNYLLTSSGIDNPVIIKKILEALAGNFLNDDDNCALECKLLHYLEYAGCKLGKAENIARNIIELTLNMYSNCAVLPTIIKLNHEVKADISSTLEASGLPELRRLNELQDLLVTYITGQDTNAATEIKIKNYLKANKVPETLANINTAKILNFATQKAKDFKMQLTKLKIENEVKFEVNDLLRKLNISKGERDKLSKRIRDAIIDHIFENDSESLTRSKLFEHFKKANLSDINAEKASNTMLELSKNKIAQYQNVLPKHKLCGSLFEDVDDISTKEVFSNQIDEFNKISYLDSVINSEIDKVKSKQNHVSKGHSIGFLPMEPSKGRSQINSNSQSLYDIIRASLPYQEFLTQALNGWIDSLSVDKTYFDESLRGSIIDHIIKRNIIIELDPDVFENDAKEIEILSELFKRLTQNWNAPDVKKVVPKINELWHKISNVPFPRLVKFQSSITKPSDPLYNKLPEIHTTIQDWVDSLSFDNSHSPEEKSIKKQALQQRFNQIIDENIRLLDDPEIYNDAYKYSETLEKNIDDAIKSLPQNRELTEKYLAFKRKLLSDMLAIRQIETNKLCACKVEQNMLMAPKESIDNVSVRVLAPALLQENTEQSLATNDVNNNLQLPKTLSQLNSVYSQTFCASNSPRAERSDPESRHVSMPSANKKRRISICLPAAYSSSTLKTDLYPVNLTKMSKWFNNIPIDKSNLESKIKTSLIRDVTKSYELLFDDADNDGKKQKYLKEILNCLTNNSLDANESGEILTKTEELSQHILFALMFLCYFSIVHDSQSEQPSQVTTKLSDPVYIRVLEALRNEIEQWAKSLPLGFTDEEKKSIAKELSKKICEINFNPNTSVYLYDNQKYRNKLESCIHETLSELTNTDLTKSSSEIKKILIDRVLVLKIRMEIGLKGSEFIQHINDTIEGSVPVDNRAPQRHASFEDLKGKISDAFIMHIVDEKHKEQYRNVIDENALKMWDRLPKSLSSCLTDSKRFCNKLYSALRQIPLPKEEIIKTQADIVQLRKLITEAFDAINSNDLSSEDKLDKIDLIKYLAERLHDERSDTSPFLSEEKQKTPEATQSSTSVEGPVTSTPISSQTKINNDAVKHRSQSERGSNNQNHLVPDLKSRTSETQTDADCKVQYQSPQIPVKEYLVGSANPRNDSQECRNTVPAVAVPKQSYEIPLNPTGTGKHTAGGRKSCSHINTHCTSSRSIASTDLSKGTSCDQESPCANIPSCSKICPKPVPSSSCLAKPGIPFFLEPSNGSTCLEKPKDYRQKLCEITQICPGAPFTGQTKSFFHDYTEFLGHFKELSTSSCPECAPGLPVKKRPKRK